jgi:Methyltransferase domain
MQTGEAASDRLRAAAVDTERYVAFLLSTLPKLAATRIYPLRWPLPMRRYAVLDRALRELRWRPGIALEFGVYRGASLSHAARRCPSLMFYGFDSFTGLPADGRPDWQIDFATAATPTVPRNCRLIAGWFADTIPAFLRENREPIGLVSIDCDVYSSARTILFGLGDRLRPGAVVYFDELINYDTFLWNEMLALFEFLEASGLGIEWIAAHCRVRGLDDVFSLYEADRYPSWDADVAAGYHRPAAALLTGRNDDVTPRSPADKARIAALAAAFERFTARYEAMRPRGLGDE